MFGSIMETGKRQYDPVTSWKEYMINKKQKLQDQFQDEVDVSKERCEQQSKIFEGISIHVNGYTQPSSIQLKALMSKHGGRFEQYPSRTVTHVIATSLPHVKLKLLRG